MHVSVTFRHLEATEPLKEYALEKLHRIKKYFPDPIQGHVVLATERHLHRADVVITLHNGLVIKGREETEDMYSSIDLVMARIERQVRKYKDKIRSHRPTPGPQVHVRHQVMTAESLEATATEAGAAVAAANAGAAAAPSGPQVIKSSQFLARTMTVSEAVMQMNLIENDFLVFTNTASREINVVYRRRDGHYGLIETGARPSEG